MGDPKIDKALKDKARRQHESEELDEELDESFPASDPPSSTQPAPRDRKPKPR